MVGMSLEIFRCGLVVSASGHSQWGQFVVGIFQTVAQAY